MGKRDLLKLFEGKRCVRFNPGRQALRIEGDSLLMGDMAGPDRHISNTVHEMAHFVEIDEARMGVAALGLKLPEVYVFGHRCIEPTTCQATKREIRVTAFQANLCKLYKIRFSVRDAADTLKYLPDTTWVPLEDGQMPYAEGRDHGLNTRQIEQSQTKWREAQIREAMKTYTAELFLHEWERRTAILDAKRASP